MKKYFIALVTLLTLLTASSNAQVNFNNQVIVYFKSGIQRNAPTYITVTDYLNTNLTLQTYCHYG